VPVPTYFFLDTEWADEQGIELVSLALVSEDGAQEFYAEREHLSDDPTDFVKERVYPLLDRGDTLLSDDAMTSALRAFLSRVALPFVLADFPNDLKLFLHVLEGFPFGASSASRRSMALVTTLMCRDEKTTALLERWFAMHPREAARRHHALVDARALRMAWLAATSRPGGEWSGPAEQE
jgi:hypothetical protein